jgi:hypothetical protein
MLGGDGLRPVDGGGEEGMVGEEVDPSRQGVGGLEDGLDGGRLEEWELASGEAEAMLEVGSELFARDAADVCSHDDALSESVEGGHVEPSPQAWVADEDDAEAVLGVHGVVGQQAQVLEDVSPEAQEMHPA